MPTFIPLVREEYRELIAALPYASSTKGEEKMMYDLLRPSGLTSAIADSPDLLALLSILFLAIVGLAVSLVLLEMAHSSRKHPR